MHSILGGKVQSVRRCLITQQSELHCQKNPPKITLSNPHKSRTDILDSTVRKTDVSLPGEFRKMSQCLWVFYTAKFRGFFFQSVF